MVILQTAERSTHLDSSENVIYQRHLVAYKQASKLIHGTVLEIGSGEGYGMRELIPNLEKYIGIDKYNTSIPPDVKNNNITLFKAEVPPLSDIKDSSIDYVVTFQVIEHIHDDVLFLKEIHRVLKPGGKLILTTPNSTMSLTRNPWHIREYNPEEMKGIVKKVFDNCELYGVFGNEKVMTYYNKNKAAVKKITRFDIFNMQYWLPRWMLQIPYDILNRFNRHNLHDKDKEIVDSITYKDYEIKSSAGDCLDHFCVATKY
tara:strand:- start:297 stop:1073 length:777 start_codon:yes stop_codon:yes gene_type:complete